MAKTLTLSFPWGSLAALGLALILAAVAASAARSAELAGSEWRPTQIGELRLGEETGIFLRFAADGRVNGHGGCNGFFGSYELSNNTLTFSHMGVTQMACPEEIMGREQAFFAALGKVKSFVRDGTVLVLSDDSGNEVARFQQTDWD
jgi:putative lipoprotein